MRITPPKAKLSPGADGDKHSLPHPAAERDRQKQHQMPENNARNAQSVFILPAILFHDFLLAKAANFREF